MAPPEELFTVPIPAQESHPGGGTIICTTPAPQVYLLTFTSAPDNRLTPEFCRALLIALDIIEYGHEPGVMVTTSGIKKFYSNGINLESAIASPAFWESSLYPLYRRLLTYPMPTVALINGHAFAGGIMLAMHHDYRVFTASGRGFACVNELELRMPLPPPLCSIFRVKTLPSTFRALVLEARRFDGRAALEAGLVDAVGELDAVLNLVEERRLVEKAASKSYGWLKTEMYCEVVALLDVKDVAAVCSTPAEMERLDEVRRENGRAWLRAWREGQDRKGKGKAKL
ncbi:enoyl-CoA hydratase/isomerase [Xylaria nigripes]|nr:enoyl-CoA hydratase/isomerase [Xylaria nigripes]